MDNSMIIDEQNDFGTSSFHIDERLQEVLGHYCKYFQEAPLANCHSVNFGKYGSFLPDCQLSPCKSPLPVPSDNGFTTSFGRLKVPPRKHGVDTTTDASSAKGSSARLEVSRKDSVIPATDQSTYEMPNIHMKLDGETYATPKNKRIHQSLGLAMSSSSSEGDSPICERRFTGSVGGISASFSEVNDTLPVFEDVFLSPLPDTLISLLESPRGVDRHACESVGRNSNPSIGDISRIYEMLEYKTMSSMDICGPSDSVEKRVVKSPVCPNSPAKRFSPEPGGMSTSLTKMENMANEDPKYRSTSDNGNENLSRKKKRKLKHIRRLWCKGDGVLQKNSNLETSSQMISKPSVEASVLSKVSSLSKEENYVNVVKMSPLRSAASCRICSPRECSESQNVQSNCTRSPDEAITLIREANDLKFCGNGLKLSGFRNESTEIFFQAALKYLEAASLLATHISGSAKNVALTPCKIYDTTAKLLAYCAQEYESCKDMACAALAYKCLEASNLQIVYSNDDNARRDSQALQVSLQSLTSGLSSLETSPLDSRTRSMFVQLLNFAEYATAAMEASRKSKIAFGYASEVLEEMGSSEVVDSIKRALNYGFHDMKKLLHLVHEAMEALSS